jgi:SNF2 family DNA or RNA helicase
LLELIFSTRAGRVLISCDAASGEHLQALRSRYASSVSVTNLSFDLELDDLLVNLRELARWPSDDTNIQWQPELRRLVEDNHADAGVLLAQLTGPAANQVNRTPRLVQGAWNTNLTDFQRRDIEKLLGLAHGANFSVPGAGKTRVTLAVFQARRDVGEVRRMLVVCPKAAFESWQTETRVCFPDTPFRVAVMDSALPPLADILLINYERLPDARETLIQWLRQEPALFVLDEAHRIKLGQAGAWGAACLAIGIYAARRMILTGTPAPNSAKDLENLLAFVWPGQGRATVTRALLGNDIRRASAILRPLFVRTTKSELRLPPLDIAIRRVELPPLHRELYNALLGQAHNVWRGGENDVEALGKILLYLLMAATTPALLATGSSRHEPLPYRVPPLEPPRGTTLNELMRDLPQYELSPKYREALAIVSANASNGRKTLIWSTFVRNLTSLEALLTRFQPAIVHGGSEDRPDQLARFREDRACMVLLSNPATLGEGISLHRDCHDAVYIDRDFAAGRFMQSLDRIHRLGLSNDVRTQITVLVANETIDELVEQRLAAKLQFMGGILDDPAVLELGDLDEEPSVGIGMDSNDLHALIGYLNSNVAS